MSDEQTAGEPVAWALLNGGASPMAVTLDHGQATFYATANGAAIMPLYAHPRPRVGVTEAMVDAFLSAYAKCETYNGWTFTHRMGVRAGIRAALADSPAPLANGGGEVADGR